MGTEIKIEDYMVEKAPPSLEPEQRPSTGKDYWNTGNLFGLQYNNPKLRYDSTADDSNTLDTQDPAFRSVYDVADIQTKREMIKARSSSHAIKIAGRRRVQAENQRAIDQDGFGKQLLYNFFPALASPTTFIPIAGIAGKAFQVGKQVNNALRIANMANVGAITGATANVIDEALLGAQGMETHMLSAGLVGAGFGGTLGIIGGALAGPYRKTHAEAMSREGDTFTSDFERDPNFKTEIDEDGLVKIVHINEEMTPQIGRQGKGLTDYIPFLGKFLKSDVTIVYQSDSSVLRGEMSQISGSTVAFKDRDDNVIPTPLNAVNDMKSSDGVLLRLKKELEDSYHEGVTGSYSDFIDEVSTMYTKAAMEQEIKVYKQVDSLIKEIKEQFNKEMKEAKAKQQEASWYYKDPVDGKHKPVTEEMISTDTVPEGAFTKKPTKKDTKLFNEEIENNYRTQMDEEINMRVDEVYEATPARFEGTPQHVKAAESYRSYYQKSLKKGQEVGIKELGGLSPNRLYRPRAWDFKAIKSGKIPEAEVRARLRDALESHPNQAGLSKTDMDKAVEETLLTLQNSVFDLNNLKTSWLVSKDVPFAKMLRNRKIKLDETKLGPLLKENLQDTTGAYHYKTKGRQALANRLGIVDDESADIYMKNLRQRLQDEGNIFTKEEFAAFERTIKDVTGDLRMNQLSDTPAWTWARNLSAYNSTRLGGGFGGNQFIELASNLMFNGISALTSGRMGASFKNAGKLLYTKGKVDDQVTNAMINSGFLETALHPHRSNRFSDGDSGFNSGWLENGLNGINDSLQKWNAMRYFTAAMEDHTGGMIMEQISTMAKRGSLSGAELSRLGRWGLTPADAKSLAKDLDKYYSPSEGRLELHKFSERNQVKFQQAIQNGISEMVVQGDSIHVPAWMKTPGPLLRLFTQFMRFPLIANEVLLRKGMSDEQAKFYGAIIASTMTYMGLKYVREQASIQAGLIHESDAKFDYFGYNSDEALMRGIGGSLNYNAQLGMMSSLWNIGANATGNSELGRDYASNNQMEAFMGPTFGGTATDILALTKSLADGEIGSERDMMRVKSAIMLNNLPIIDEALKAVVKEMN